MLDQVEFDSYLAKSNWIHMKKSSWNMLSQVKPNEVGLRISQVESN